MEWIESPAELTTAATDLLLAAECVLIALWFAPRPHPDRFRAVLWTFVFGLTALAALLGAIVHAVAWPDSIAQGLWKPLYLSLGIIVALFVAGAVCDWLGPLKARRLVLYEAVAMLVSLAIYCRLAIGQNLPGAGLIALAIALNLLAAAVQASDIVLTLMVPFDHNALFHLVQMLAVAVLGTGLRRGFTGFNRRGNGLSGQKERARPGRARGFVGCISRGGKKTDEGSGYC